MILDQIAESKKKEVEEKSTMVNISHFRSMAFPSARRQLSELNSEVDGFLDGFDYGLEQDSCGQL